MYFSRIVEVICSSSCSALFVEITLNKNIFAVRPSFNIEMLKWFQEAIRIVKSLTNI